MYKGSVTKGPDRLSILMALGSCYEEQPITPAFSMIMEQIDRHGSAALSAHLRVSSVAHESGSPGMYMIEGLVVHPISRLLASGFEDEGLLQPDYTSFKMFYDANTKRGHVAFLKIGETSD